MGLAERCLMTWEPSQARWRKMYRGKTYTASCFTLGCRPTKEDSYQAANDWWRAKRAEIDGQVEASKPHADDIAEYRLRRDWCLSHGQEQEAQKWEDMARQLEEDPDFLIAPTRRFNVIANLVFRHLQSGGTLKSFSEKHIPAESAEEYDPEEIRWDERLGGLHSPNIPNDMTVGAQVRAYLELEKQRLDNEEIGSDQYSMIVRCVNFFRDWIGAQSSVEVIDADRWKAFFKHLSSLTDSAGYKKKKMQHARAFIQELITDGKIPAIGNLENRKRSFKTVPTTIETFTKNEVREVVEKATGELKLQLLLMLNCGMTQIDISELAPGEIDWQEGVIERKRSKTRDASAKVPTVRYRLWAETLRLLRLYGHRTGSHALLNEGKPWVRKGGEGGGRTDGIGNRYDTLQKKLSFRRPLTCLRATASSKLDEHPEHSRYAILFLGHAPSTIAAKHYVQPSQEQFDAAVRWLGQQFGFEPQAAQPPKARKRSGR